MRKVIKGTKTKAGTRKVLLLPPAKEALLAQKQFTFLESKYIFHNPHTNVAWETDQQVHKTAWRPIIRRSGVRYRNPYQTRHTYASMMLSDGENIMWVSNQMGHADIEMVMRTYGRWIPDNSLSTGYQLVNDWGEHAKIDLNDKKSQVN